MTNETLRTEACKKLNAYVQTGIMGFLHQGLDRLQAVGMTTTSDWRNASREQVKVLLPLAAVAG